MFIYTGTVKRLVCVFMWPVIYHHWEPCKNTRTNGNDKSELLVCLCSERNRNNQRQGGQLLDLCRHTRVLLIKAVDQTLPTVCSAGRRPPSSPTFSSQQRCCPPAGFTSNLRSTSTLQTRWTWTNINSTAICVSTGLAWSSNEWFRNSASLRWENFQRLDN